jgi:hypothetical protein
MHTYAAPLILLLSSPKDIDKLPIARHLLNLLPHTIAYPPLLVGENEVVRNEDAQDNICVRVLEQQISAAQTRRSVVVVTAAADELLTDMAGNVYRDAARRCGRVFVPVVLVNGAGREESGPSEALSRMDVDDGAKSREEGERLSFGTDEEVVLGVTGMKTEDVAAKIARWVWWVSEFMSWGAQDAYRCEEECE